MSADRDDTHDDLESRLAKANPFAPGEIPPERARFEHALRDTILAERPTARRPTLTRRRVIALGIGVVMIASAGVSVAVLNREAPPSVKARRFVSP